MNPIAKGLKDGDTKVIRQLYSDHLDKVVGWVKRSGGRQEDGEDIFQDTLEALIIKAHRGGIPEGVVIGAYIMQMAKNKWIDLLRRKKLDEKVRLAEDNRHIVDNQTEQSIITAEEEQEKHRMLKKTLGQLSPLCQQLLRMIMAERKTDEIVTELEFSNANTMYRRKFACMKSWKSQIEKYRQGH